MVDELVVLDEVPELGVPVAPDVVPALELELDVVEFVDVLLDVFEEVNTMLVGATVALAIPASEIISPTVYSPSGKTQRSPSTVSLTTH